MKLLFKNKNYLKLTISMSLTFGVMVAVMSIMDKGLKAMNYKQPAHMIANIAIAAIISGIIGTIFYSIMVKRTKKYKLFSVIRNFIFI